MKKLLSMFMALAALAFVAIPALAVKPSENGFNEFGYNYEARLFSGKSDGVDKVWGNDVEYGNDHLVMKWSKAWDDAKFNGAAWTCDAWENNEWNGNTDGGSGEMAHYKIVWVGPELQNSSCWRDGGYPIWGQFEVIMDHGVYDGEHVWFTHANPTGYGAY